MAGLTQRTYSYSNVQRSADGSRVRSTGRSVVNTGNRIVVGNPGSGLGAVSPESVKKMVDAAKATVGLKLQGAQTQIQQAVSQATAGLGANKEQIKALMQRLAAERGWVGPQWDALHRLEMKEAGYNPYAQNPTSTAYGLGQFLDKTWGDYGHKKTSDPLLQIKAMYDYIAKRYGDPGRALQAHLRQNWY